MASGTPSWSLSSMALMPDSIREFSISAAADARSFSRSSAGAVPAAAYLFCQDSRKLWSTIFEAIASVRSPCIEYCCRCSSTGVLKGSSHKALITLSAPFVMQKNSPLCSQMIDMRFRSELKGISHKTVRIWGLSPGGPVMCSSQPELPGCRLRAWKEMPMLCAASRNATSSGELPLYLGTPSSPMSTCAVWQVTKQKKNQRTSARRGSSS
mmetsp:Transcript_44387/g.83206  ORF Transcript_44387/g.83206 Transcript_44387/m.83206 type:complete len:211 (+) Transcript_44387:1431-2063(+)